MDTVDISAEQSDGMGGLSADVLEAEEVVGHLRRPGHLTGPLQPQDQQVQHQAVVLHDERGELQPADDTVAVGVVHVLRNTTDDMQQVG